ncbi:MAG: D-2-hydroxyacid dehydrogenase [Bacillota bacterium]
MEIVVLDGHALNPGDLSWQSLEELGSVTVYDSTPDDKIIPRIGDAEIVLTNKTPLKAETFEQAPQIKYVGVLATGYNVVDIEAARENNITVTNIPNYGTDAVAQHTFALLLELANHVGEHNRAVKAGQWEESEDFCFWKQPVMELVDKTIGIIGYGRIGQRTAEIAQVLGMKVLAYDPQQSEMLENSNVQFAELDKLLAQADVISLHCPLVDSTKEIINQQTLAQMKEEVLIVNTARGELIVESDLVQALEEGMVAGAAVDVLTTEPPNSDNPLLTAPNTIITPHIAWAAQESRQRLLDIAVDNVQSFLKGKTKNVVS